MHERYLRWVLGVNGKTPLYLVRKEIQREKMRKRREGVQREIGGRGKVY